MKRLLWLGIISLVFSLSSAFADTHAKKSGEVTKIEKKFDKKKAVKAKGQKKKKLKKKVKKKKKKVKKPSHVYKYHSSDTNRDGKVSPDEFSASIKKRMEQMDANGDGKVSVEEEKAYIQKKRESIKQKKKKAKIK
jgi:hypothetical protein